MLRWMNSSALQEIRSVNTCTASSRIGNFLFPYRKFLIIFNIPLIMHEHSQSVSRIMSFQKCWCSNLYNMQMCSIKWKNRFRVVIKLMILRLWDYPELSEWPQCNHKDPWKTEREPGEHIRPRKLRWERQKDSNVLHFCLWRGKRRYQAQKWWQTLGTAKEKPLPEPKWCLLYHWPQN